MKISDQTKRDVSVMVKLLRSQIDMPMAQDKKLSDAIYEAVSVAFLLIAKDRLDSCSYLDLVCED